MACIIRKGFQETNCWMVWQELSLALAKWQNLQYKGGIINSTKKADVCDFMIKT